MGGGSGRDTLALAVGDPSERTAGAAISALTGTAERVPATATYIREESDHRSQSSRCQCENEMSIYAEAVGRESEFHRKLLLRAENLRGRGEQTRLGIVSPSATSAQIRLVASIHRARARLVMSVSVSQSIVACQNHNG